MKTSFDNGPEYEQAKIDRLARLGGNPVYEDRLKGITPHGFPCHPLPEKLYAGISTAYKALALWRELFREGLSPIDDRGYCLFCPIGLMDRHSPDCIYLRAKALIEES